VDHKNTLSKSVRSDIDWTSNFKMHQYNSSTGFNWSQTHCYIHQITWKGKRRMTIKARVIITVLWLIFIGIFLNLYYQHLSEAKRSIPEFKMTRQVIISQSTTPPLDLDKPLADFVRDFNAYLKDYNESSSIANQRSARGYLFAALIALVSIVLVWWDTVQELFTQYRDAWVKR
jgi:hypothetical protein